MLFRTLAEITLVVHLAFVVFVVIGGFLVLRWRWLAWLHLPAVAWGAFVELSGRICPLTPLEVYFREQAGLGGYEGGFIDHYLTAWIYPDGLTREIQIGLGIGVTIVNCAVYWWIFHGAKLRARRKPVSPP